MAKGYSTKIAEPPKLVGDGKDKILLAYTSEPVSFAVGNGIPKAQKAVKGDWVDWWSPTNTGPEEIIEIVTNNNINPGIIGTKADFIVGQGLMLYTEEIVDGKLVKKAVADDAIQAFIDDNDLNEVMRRCAMDLVLLGNFFMEVGAGLGLDRVVNLKHKDPTVVRSGYLKDGAVKEFFLCADWSRARYNRESPSQGTVETRPAFSNNISKWADGMTRIWHGKDYFPKFPYYTPPAWLGNKNWIRLANEIPLWHYAGIKNGYSLRYHIEIPESYFDDCDNIEQVNVKKDRIKDQMNSFLSGSDNSQKSFMSFVRKNALDTDLWKITPIDANLNDSAFTVLFEQSTSAMTAGHAIHPSLVGVESQGKLSSGSEMRIAFQNYQILKTPTPRRILLKPIQEIAKINKWNPKIKIGFKDVEITTLDVNPTGTQNFIS